MYMNFGNKTCLDFKIKIENAKRLKTNNKLIFKRLEICILIS